MGNSKNLTAGEVAERLRMSVAALYSLRHRGEGPPAIRLGRRVLFPESELERWLAERLEVESR
jgi:excisionase family DNA binding protein